MSTRLNVFREVVDARLLLGRRRCPLLLAVGRLAGDRHAGGRSRRALIERDRGGVRPTAAGAALAGHVGGILARMEAAEAEIAAIAAGRGGRLRIGLLPDRRARR